MKRFTKWILKKLLMAVFCFAVSALAAMFVCWFFFENDKELLDADAFVQTFATAVFEKDYDVYRSMMYDGGAGTNTMQRHEEELARSWLKFQASIDERLFGNKERTQEGISKIVAGVRCSDVCIYRGIVAAVYDFGDEGMRVIVGKAKNCLKVLTIY